MHFCVLSIACAAAVLSGAAAHAGEAIYWTEDSSTHGRIQRMDLSTGEVRTIRSAAGENPTGLAVDPQAGFLFWGDSWRNGVFRARLDGSDVRQLAFSNSPRSLDVDAASRLLYWSDAGVGAVSSISYEGGQSQAIIDLLIPNGVAYDSRTQQIYWSDSSLGEIGRAEVDGSNPTVLLGNLHTPGRLRVDSWRDRLLWTNGGGDFQAYSLLDGETSTVSHGPGFVRPFDVTPDGLYWLDTLNGGVYHSALDGSGVELLYDERFYHQSDVRWVPEPVTLVLMLVAGAFSARRMHFGLPSATPKSK